jgi:pyridoxal phosphate enzyme (YggS family)
MATSGSAIRAASVNSQSTAGDRRLLARALTARAHVISLLSMSEVPKPDSPHPVAAALAAVRARIAAAARRAGRAPEDVALVAVSKTQPTAAVMQAIAAGQLLFGENRVQEATAKFPPLRAAHPGLELHLIGGLQTNKARDAVRVADVIETLDRPKLADAIAAAGEREGRLPALLVQVNTGDEPQKSGVSRAAADAFIASMRDRFGPALRGLMCIPPANADPAPHFAWLAACAARHGLTVLSMGMSADFEIAIAHGATHVRIGSAIFGSRPVPRRPGGD